MRARAASFAVAAVIVVAIAGAVGTATLVQRGPSITAAPAPSVFAGAYRFGSCTTTPVSIWSLVMPYGRGIMRLPDRPVIIGGRLGTAPTRNLTTFAQWYIAAEPQPMIHLRATRLDRDALPIEFDAIGYATPELYPAEWNRGWYYRTSPAAGALFPTTAGCWKIQLLDAREDDVVVVELRGVIATR